MDDIDRIVEAILLRVDELDSDSRSAPSIRKLSLISSSVGLLQALRIIQDVTGRDIELESNGTETRRVVKHDTTII